MAADTTYPSVVQIRQDGNLAVPTGKSIDVESGGALKLAGTEVVATADELNRVADLSSRIVTVAAATTSLAITATEHSEKIIVLNTIPLPPLLCCDFDGAGNLDSRRHHHDAVQFLSIPAVRFHVAVEHPC